MNGRHRAGRCAGSLLLASRGAVAATPAGGHPAAIPIDGAWFYNQTYALCNTALCARSAEDPSIAHCRCVVLDGYSIGFKTCDERAYTTELLSGTSLEVPGVKQYEVGMPQVQPTITLPAICPGVTPVASPDATPAAG